MKTPLGTKKKPSKHLQQKMRQKNGELKTHRWSSCHPNRRVSSSWHDWENRILRKARRAPLRKSQTRGKRTSRLPAFTKLRRFEKLSEILEKQIRKETQQTFATKLNWQHLPPLHPDSPQKKTPQNVNNKQPFFTHSSAPWSMAGSPRWDEWRSSYLHRSHPVLWRKFYVTKSPRKCRWKSHSTKLPTSQISTRDPAVFWGSGCCEPKKLFKLKKWH